MKIYIILTYTGTILSKIIKFYTKDQFAHVSLALDVNLNQMYSFGRLHPYNPFVGGFVHEYINQGTYKRFKNTRARIIEIEINKTQYYKLKKIINYMEIHKTLYKFNIWGLFAVAFHLKIKGKNSFYCAEFIKYVTEKSNINMNLPELVKPENFNNELLGHIIYNGLLNEYTVKEKINN